jgi:hypothetical protein
MAFPTQHLGLYHPSSTRPPRQFAWGGNTLFLRLRFIPINPDDIQAYDFWGPQITPSSFNMDLQNLAADGDVQRAQDALEIVEENYLKTVGDGCVGAASGLALVKPDVNCYNTVIHGWVHSDHPRAASRAQALLDRLEELYDKSGDDSIWNPRKRRTRLFVKHGPKKTKT